MGRESQPSYLGIPRLTCGWYAQRYSQVGHSLSLTYQVVNISISISGALLAVHCQVATGDSVMSMKLKATLKRIAENLIISDSDELSSSGLGGGVAGGVAGESAADDCRDRVPHPHLSPSVDLHRPDTLYGLVERVVATESL